MIKNKDIIAFLGLITIIVIALIISLINNNERLLSFAIGATGPAIGLVIGTLIRARKKVTHPKKIRLDVFILLSLAIIGSILISILLDGYKSMVVCIMALNIALAAILLFRNAAFFTK